MGCRIGKSEQGRFNRITRAKSICYRCPERQRCADWAIDTGQDFGIWGGMTERERKNAKKNRSRRG